MMEKRVYVGIRISAALVQACENLQRGLNDLPVRLIAGQDLHLTLVPPWNTDDVHKVTERLRFVVGNARRFDLSLQSLAYGPPDRAPEIPPQFVWILCAPSAALLALRQNLCDAIGVAEQRAFLPHITLARFNNANDKPQLLRPVNARIEMAMPVDSIELFESPNQAGAGYTVLASIPILRP